MSFINNEMVLMNSNEDVGGYGLLFISMGAERLKEVKDKTGINIVEEQIFWHTMETAPGQYNWELSDRQVNRVLDAGMKCLLCTPISVPGFLPKEWYWADVSGAPMTGMALSFWNQDARSYQIDFIQKVIDRYSSSDVQVIYHGFLGGESIMFNPPLFYDPAAIADFEKRYGAGLRPVVGPALGGNQWGDPETGVMPYQLDANTKEWLRDAIIRFHLDIQYPFMRQYNEVWDSAQPLIGLQSEANGNYAQYDLHKAYAEAWPGVEQWLLMYTYFGNGPWSQATVQKMVDDFGCKVLVEANYCEGLKLPPPTWITAIELGFQGQIVCPLHPFREHQTIEPWMFHIMLRANNAWQNGLGIYSQETLDQWRTEGVSYEP